jgi:hypothetical protein
MAHLIPVRLVASLLIAGLFFTLASANPWDGEFDWSEIPEIYPGIRHVQISVNEPHLMALNVLQVDLGNPNIRLHTTGRAPDWGEPMPEYPHYTIRSARQRTLDYLNIQRQAGRNMVAAINAAPWYPWDELSDSGKINYPHADRLGLTVSDGEIVDYPDPLAPATFAITRDWRASMFASDAQTPTDNLLTAVSGFALVLTEGNVSGGTSLEPRTGYGLCKDNRYLVLMTIDGRQSGYSDGAGRRHVGLWLRHFGSWNGINMDGGGSTTMALRNPSNGNINIVNQHSNHWLIGARRVGNNLGIFFIDEPEEIPFAD